MSLFSSSYRVVVEEFMDRRVVAVAKGDGFEEVLAALSATTDGEFPVVESAGRARAPRGRGGHGDTSPGGRGDTSPGSCPPPGSPTLVGTVSRARLVAFLQSHEHPRAPPGALQEKVNPRHPPHPKERFFHPKKLTRHLLPPPCSQPPWGQLGTTAPSSPSCCSSRPGPRCTRFGVGAGGTKPPPSPNFGFVPMCPPHPAGTPPL